MTDIKEKIIGAASKLEEGAAEVSHEIKERAEDAWNTVQQQTNHAVQASSAYVHKNPAGTAVAAFGVGLTLGLLVNRRPNNSLRQYDFADSLQQSRGMLLGLLVACGAVLRRTFSSAAHVAEEAADNFKSELNGSLDSLRNLRK